jgi:putative ABC transport system permease protein
MMPVAPEVVLAFRSMWRHRLRTFLMMSGVIVGVASLTVLNSIGEATKQEAMKRFKNMVGTFDTITIRPGAGRTRGMVSLTNVPATLKFEDAQVLAAEVSGVKQLAELQNAFDMDVKYGDRAGSTAVFGVSSNWFELRGDAAAEGSLFGVEEEKALARVAILGADVEARLFSGEGALRKTIRIGEVPFQVEGVLQSRGAGPAGGSLDDLILIPVTTAAKRLFHRDFLTMLIVQLRDPSQSDAAVQGITTFLRERHHLAPSAPNDFTVSNPRAVMAQVTQMGSTLSKTLEGIAILAMLIGGVVIMSLMLIGVSERRREIGIRRCVGASRVDILLQFILEALTISCLGGVTGVAVAFAGTQVVARFQKLPLTLAWDVLAISAGLSLAVGLLFGLYPAWKAAHVDPIAALRA